MTEVKCDNGVILHWDETISPGTLVTAYEKGFHIFLYWEFRGENNPPLAHYQRMLTASGVPSRRVTGTCDGSYVRRVDREQLQGMYIHEMNQAHIKRDNLLKYVS